MNYSRSSHSEMSLRKGVLKICSKVTGQHPCRSAISIKFQSNFIEIAHRHRCSSVTLLHIFSKEHLWAAASNLCWQLTHLWKFYSRMTYITPIAGQYSLFIRPENIRKPFFLVFSGDIKWEHRPEMAKFPPRPLRFLLKGDSYLRVTSI